MLQELRIHDLGLVTDLLLPVGRGLTVLTGETGAGKSMLAGAVAALAGAEVDKSLVRTGAEEAWVEGLFDLGDRPGLREALHRAGVSLAGDDLLVVRREIRREGRNRVLLNGLTTSLAVLRQVGPLLVSVQSQDQQRELARPGFFRDLLDELVGVLPLREEVALAWQHWRETTRALAEARRELDLLAEQHDLWRYQYEELTAAGLDGAEEQNLRERIAMKRDAVATASALDEAWQRLGGEEADLAAAVGGVVAVLTRLADHSPRLQAIVDLLAGAEARLQEAVLDLSRLRDDWDADPAGLDELEERLALYQQLQRKYQRDTAGLLALQEELAARLARYQDGDAELAHLAQERDRAAGELVDLALRLRRLRQESAAEAAARLRETLRPLALPHLELTFHVAPRAGTGQDDLEIEGQRCHVERSGADRVELLVAMNPGEAGGPVARVASGGERSRLLLGITAVRSATTPPVLQLFDEIDAGVGMDTAPSLGRLLRQLSRRGQVLCITHLATLAVAGDQHWRADKLTRQGRTVLHLQQISGAERVAEIARLLGSDAGDATAVAHARRLLGEMTAREGNAG